MANAQKARPKDGSSRIFISERGLSAVIIVLLVVALSFTLSALYLKWRQKRLFKIETAFLVFGLANYITYQVDWLVMFPPMYKVNKLTEGLIDIYPSFPEDLHLYLMLITIGSLLLWTLLWSIKLSLLFLYRRLMRGLPNQLRWWWLVFAITVTSYIFCMATTFTSCGGFSRMLANPSLFCKRPQDNMTRNLNFYGAFAFDIFTDLAIMALPISLIWSLQMSLRRKLSVGVIFIVAGLCMIAAIVRLVQINSKTGSKNPNNQWLAVWGSTEATVAMIVGSLPTFASQWHRGSESTLNYGSNGQHNTSKLRSQSIPLGTVSRQGGTNVSTTAWKGSTSSQEELTPATGIRVTTNHLIQESFKTDPTSDDTSRPDKPHRLHPSSHVPPATNRV